MVKQKTLLGEEIPIKKIKEIINESSNTTNKENIKKRLTQYARNVWSFKDPPRKIKNKVHGATFSKEMAKRIIWIYSEENDFVYDGFLGTGTTLEACIELNRNFIGSELNPNFYTKFILPLLQQKEFYKNLDLKVINGDCRDVLEYVSPCSIKLIFTSPPYADFIHKSIVDRKDRSEKYLIYKESYIKPYSNSDRDLGNYEYENFLKEFKIIFEHWYNILIEEIGYAVFIVKNYRVDKYNHKELVLFDYDLINIAKSVGFVLHGFIIQDQNEHRKLQLNGSKKFFYNNLNTNSIIILRKPSDAEIKKGKKNE